MKGIWCLDRHEWLEHYDPDGGDLTLPYPTGTFATTADKEFALKFDSAREALECWMQQSTRTPNRPDGRPNRPLTALSVTVKDLDDDQELGIGMRLDD